MRLLLILSCFILASCSTSKIRFVKVKRQHTETVAQTPERKSNHISSEETFAPELKESQDEQEEIQVQDATEEQEEVLVNADAMVAIAYSEETIENIPPQVVNTPKAEKTPDQLIYSGNRLLTIGLIALIVAFVMVAITLFAGIGMPFIYFYLASLVFYILGWVKAEKGYRSIANYKGNKEELYTHYKKGKLLRRIMGPLLMLWLCLFIFLLLLPLLQLGGEALSFIFSGGINLSGLSLGLNIVG